MAIETKVETAGVSTRYKAVGDENTDSGAITIDLDQAFGTNADGFTVGESWPYYHQVAVHTAATSGTFTVTVKPVGLDEFKDITDGVITLTATASEQIPILFDGHVSAIKVTPAGMSSQAYDLSVTGSSS